MKVQRIIGVGFGRFWPRLGYVLRRIASAGKGNVIGVRNIGKLDDLINPMRQRICGREIARCSATGDPHYKTFDGKRYDFMGKCQYVLMKHYRGYFKVLQKNEPCGNGRVTCTKTITVIFRLPRIRSLVIRVFRGGKVTVNGRPYRRRIKGLSITRKGREVTIARYFRRRLRWKVTYNGVYNVYVDISSRFKGKVKGLCGNYNGNPGDDFTGTAAQFGNSWKVKKSCPDAPDLPDPCKSLPDKLQRSIEKECSLLKGTLPFGRCNKFVDPTDYIKNCKYDVCSCRGSRLPCLCQAYDAYSEDCSPRVPIIRLWPQKVKECRSPCASGPCLNGGTCISIKNSYKCFCPMEFSGRVCGKGTAIARCSATGDPHYKTFDGKRYDFMGKCQYVLAKHKHGHIEVLQQNEPCGNGKVTCTKTITVKIAGLEILVVRGGVVTVDGAAVTPPYKNRGVSITKQGTQVTIQRGAGLKVTYNGVYNVHVDISSRYMGDVSGLCGNYNGNPGDDFQGAGSAVQFGNSWKVEKSCPDAPDVSDPCGSLSVPERNIVIQRCSRLTKIKWFKGCNDLVASDDYVKNCIYDVCGCKNSPSSCLCQAFEAYSGDCSAVGANTKGWRDEISDCSICSSPKLDLVYVVDGSGSVGPQNFDSVKKFITQLNTRFDIGREKTHVGLLQYGTKKSTKVEFNLGSFDTLEAVNEEVSGMTYLNSRATYTGYALDRARTEIFDKKGRANVPRVLILLTDGAASDKSTQLIAAKNLKVKGVKIITVGIGLSSTIQKFEKDLKQIASNENLVFEADFSKLDSISGALVQKSCGGNAVA